MRAKGRAVWAVVGLVLVGLWWACGLSQERLVVVINEFGQGKGGNGEWIELLVVGGGPGTAVDLRGWVLQDRQGEARGGVFITFSDHTMWATVPAGTLVVIYNAGDRENLPAHFPRDDFDLTDFVVVVPSNAEEFFTTSRWEGLANAGDVIILVDAQGVVMDTLSYGEIPQELRRVPHLEAVAARRAAGYIGTTAEGVNSLDNWQYGADELGNSTPGAPNNEEQRVWLEELRRR